MHRDLKARHSLLGLSLEGDWEKERRNKFLGFKIISSLPGSQLTAITSQCGGGLVSPLLSGGNREIKKSGEGEKRVGRRMKRERGKKADTYIHREKETDSEGGKERDSHKRERERDFPVKNQVSFCSCGSEVHHLWED